MKKTGLMLISLLLIFGCSNSRDAMIRGAVAGYASGFVEGLHTTGDTLEKLWDFSDEELLPLIIKAIVIDDKFGDVFTGIYKLHDGHYTELKQIRSKRFSK